MILLPARDEARELDGVLVRLGAAVREERDGQVARRHLREHPAEPRARLVRHRRADRAELVGLVLDRLDDLRMLVPDVDVDELRGEVEVPLPVVVPEVTALRAGDRDRVDLVLHRPRVEDVLLRVRDDLRLRGSGSPRRWPSSRSFARSLRPIVALPLPSPDDERDCAEPTGASGSDDGDHRIREDRRAPRARRAARRTAEGVRRRTGGTRHPSARRRRSRRWQDHGDTGVLRGGRSRRDRVVGRMRSARHSTAARPVSRDRGRRPCGSRRRGRCRLWCAHNRDGPARSRATRPAAAARPRGHALGRRGNARRVARPRSAGRRYPDARDRDLPRRRARARPSPPGHARRSRHVGRCSSPAGRSALRGRGRPDGRGP